MTNTIALDSNGLPVLERDAGWRGEVRREMLHAILEVEDRGIAANVLSWIVAALAASFLPNAAAFVLPLSFRLFAMLVSRTAFRRLRAVLARGGHPGRAILTLAAALMLSGASCAAVLTPILTEPYIHPARMVVGGTVIVGVTLVITLLAPLWRLAAAYVAGFVGMFAAIMLLAKASAAVPTIVALCGILSVVGLYGVAMSLRHRNAAAMLVDNRHLSEELASSLAHAEFLAFHDPLTGLYNRRAFFQRAGLAVEGRDRHVLTIDLDHFKAINDRHGHATGDTVLIGVAQALRAVLGDLSAGDHYPARIGGEEFAVVVDTANHELAGTVAEMARHAIGLIGRSTGVPRLVTSASIGLCRWSPAQPIDEVLTRADAALYQAKARGRDRVMAAAA